MKSKINMSFIPKDAREIKLIERFEMAGLVHIASGKTREMFDLPEHPSYCLIYASDRVSIFDRVLGATIPAKGMVLTAITVFWLDQVFTEIDNHLIAYGSGIDQYIPPQLQGDVELQKRCLIVEKVDVLSVEAIVRGYLTGSGLKDYNKSGMVCGFELPKGLSDGSRLPEPLFTPSTKAPAGGKDENINFEQMVLRLGGARGLAGEIQEKSLKLYNIANEVISQHGIVFADTKFEFGLVRVEDQEYWSLILIDEVLTPDSSRCWPWHEGVLYDGAPPSFDKQGIRDWGERVGIKEDPTIIPPGDVLQDTQERYQSFFEIVTEMNLESFWKVHMRIEI